MSSLFSLQTISSSPADTDIDDTYTDSAPIHKLCLINLNREIEEQFLDGSNELNDLDDLNDLDHDFIQDKEFSSIFSYDDADSFDSYLAQSFETIKTALSPFSSLSDLNSCEETTITRGRTMERGTSTIRNTSVGTRFRNIIRQR
ncbi:hypothetical protein B5S28_g1188 [[Candida] boidinii]|uniref:Unnamed protein product n=1 Tax=Candida boidinii TaxID=5477 RepID=A0ACB5TPH1_CANBO|nr:hypothetical protein B5S28_g1188 [[Candida] boidinii]OWB61309.1 hypothetical protein B5S29_g2198 [[Candida] boidinii]OWB73069.1 hypothetical protein B5S31_g2801 [[Candida] boidinii]OWB78168.1 hypothetical protein B5S32_g2355 [[Candida] boidinii]GME92229.1 unnamed protein product [[Candida] boidinii]